MPAGTPSPADLEDLKKGKNYLFGIGIHDYEHFNKLPNARKDVEDVAQVLVDNYNFEPPLHPLFDGDATKENIIDKLYDLHTKVQPDDRLLIYYSGHGFMDREHGFWVPADAKEGKKGTLINNVEVRDIIKHINTRHILLISDSCFSASLLVEEPSRKIEGAFTDMIRNPSRYIFISGKGVVSDGRAGENSPFAAALLKYLRQNQDEALNIGLLADQVIKNVRNNYLQKAQLKPLFDAGHEDGEFVFLKKQQENEDWESALKRNTKAGYLSYRRKYPNGRYTKMVGQKLSEIEEEEAWVEAKKRDNSSGYIKYLDIYEGKGKHAAEANSALDLIEKEEEGHEKAATEKKDRERLAQIEITQQKEGLRLARLKAEQEEQERLDRLKAEARASERLELPEMVFVEGGAFKMGSNDYDDEKPIHTVSLNNFYMGKNEITLAQFAAFIEDASYKTTAEKEGSSYVWDGNSVDDKKGVYWKHGVSGSLRPSSEYNHPVVHVSWDDASAYCKWLNRKTGKKFRLPTEAEWEYAARGGKKAKGYTYSGSDNVDEVAWYLKNSRSATHAVGTKRPNELGIYDMSGNVWEWCCDWYGSYDSSANSATVSNPTGAVKGTARMIRGGSWFYGDKDCRVSYRNDSNPAYRLYDLGFRVACSL